MEDRSWMSLRNHACAEYLDGLKSFISAAEVAMWCPCKDCENQKQYSSSLSLHAHLILQGFMDNYRCWNKHGERCWNKHGEGGVNDPDLQAGHMDQGFSGDLRQDDGTHAADQDDEEGLFYILDLTDEKLADISANYDQKSEDLEKMVRDAMGFDEYTEAEMKKLKRLTADMRTPLYKDCKQKFSKLFGTLKLLQLKAANHWTEWSFDALLHQLEDMMPEGNELPKSTYEAKQIVCPMGLEVEKIEACKNDCILYRGKENEDLTECPECGLSRYKRRNDGGDGTRGMELLGRWYGTSL